MKVRVKIQTYWGPDIVAELKKNPIREVMIREHEKGDDPEKGWYLIDVGVKSTGIFTSDDDVRNGHIVRLYTSPELPSNYNVGPWMWVNANEAEKIMEKNKEAKFLLKSQEWFVQ